MKLRIIWDGTSHVFTASQTPTVGRVPEASVTIPVPQVSRAHLSFVFSDGRWTFEDTSSNGTFIGGQRVTVGAIAGPIVMHLGGLQGPALTLEPLSEHAPDAPLVPPVVSPPATATTPPPPPTPVGSPPLAAPSPTATSSAPAIAHSNTTGRRGGSRTCRVRAAPGSTASESRAPASRRVLRVAR